MVMVMINFGRRCSRRASQKVRKNMKLYTHAVVNDSSQDYITMWAWKLDNYYIIHLSMINSYFYNFFKIIAKSIGTLSGIC